MRDERERMRDETDTETVELFLDTEPGSPESRVVPMPPKQAAPAKKTVSSPAQSAPIPHRKAREESSGVVFTPQSGLLDRVTVSDWNTTYSYYEQFRAAALRLWDYAAEECAPVPFFSYIPQYAQMTREQLAYYLYLRQEICDGRYPEADYSYLLLLLYETINLSDVNPAEYSLSVFCHVFRGYRAVHERLGMQVADWMCDFCLIHNCVPPKEMVESDLNDWILNAGFPEFYLGLYSDVIVPATILRYSSQYDYTKSRYARGENAALYEQTMRGVLAHILTDEKLAKEFDEAMAERYTVTRDAYVGALCAPQIKKRMTVTFRSFARSHGIRFLVSDILRYTDNKLRTLLGYKSRVSVGKLPPEIKQAADAYFAKELGMRSRAGAPELPEYEKLYEPAPSHLSAEAAAEIERASWDTTEKLVEAFAEAEEPEKFTGIPPGAAPELAEETELPTTRSAPQQDLFAPAADFAAETSEPTQEPSETALSALLDAIERQFVVAAGHADAAAQKQISARAGKSCDYLADGINEKATEILGDVLLEDAGGYYTVIEDYLEDTKKEFLS